MSDARMPSMRGAVDLSSLRNRPDHASGAQSAAQQGGAAPRLVVDATDQTFQSVLELSRTVPVVVDLWAEWCGPCKELSPVIEKVVTELAGRVVLAKVDVDANPQIAQAFNAQSIPLVVGLVAGQPVPLFTGAVPEEQVREVFQQFLQVASQNGVSGSVPGYEAGAADGEAEPQPEPELPPLHQEAYVAIEAGDFDAAIAAYEKSLAENPRDEVARAGAQQVRLLKRTADADLGEARKAAADAPDDIEAQLLVADLDVAGGHVDDAFGRLLDLFARVGSDERVIVRERLVDLFGIVGEADPRVGRARARLASLLF